MEVGHVIVARDSILFYDCRKCWPECATLVQVCELKVACDLFCCYTSLDRLRTK
jgi:hypothetical protein